MFDIGARGANLERIEFTSMNDTYMILSIGNVDLLWYSVWLFDCIIKLTKGYYYYCRCFSRAFVCTVVKCSSFI